MLVARLLALWSSGSPRVSAPAHVGRNLHCLILDSENTLSNADKEAARAAGLLQRPPLTRRFYINRSGV